jgi:hypothetical protein
MTLKRSLLLICLACAFTGCHSLRIYVNEKVPPTFTFGAGIAECCTTFVEVRVFELDAAMSSPAKMIWRIASYRELDGRESTPAITYGKVPQGFEQWLPEKGEPSALVEGKSYMAVAGANYTSWPKVCFTIKGGKSIKQNCPEK